VIEEPLACGDAAGDWLGADDATLGDAGTTGTGLVAEAQATTRRATRIVVVQRESERRIPMSSGRYIA
jgi:hypothetical protein